MFELAPALALGGQMRHNTPQVYGPGLGLSGLIMSNDAERPDEPDSLELSVRRAAGGDLGAMEAIYRRFKQPVFSLACRYSSDREAVEDLVQETFIKIFTHLKDVKNMETFSAWVYRIALNECYSYLRQKKSRSQRIVPLAEVEGKLEEASYDGHERSIRKPLEEAIESLPKRLKTVFILHDVQGLKHREIARTMGSSVGTSKSQLFKARLRVRGYLRRKGVFPGVKR